MWQLELWGIILIGHVLHVNSRVVMSPKYIWRTSEWGSCIVAQGCGEGKKERRVWCAEKQKADVSLEFLCRSNDEPQRIKSCYVACRHHKEWRVSEWGPCLVTNNIVDNSIITVGVMNRNRSCVITTHDHKDVKRIIDDENCKGFKKPETVRECSPPTRQECVLTEWSEWTQCCDSTQHRTRSVLVAPHYGAQPCPQLSEWKPCETEANNCQKESKGFRLRVEKWAECRAKEGYIWDGDSQGHADNYYKHWPQVGTQRRLITCLSITGQISNLSKCMNDNGDTILPMRERACIIAQDCAVSEWTEWNVVQEGCIDPNGKEWADITVRRREILRLHEGQGQPCPHVVETKSSTSNLPLCELRYKWATTKWGKCTLPGVMGVVICGGGLEFRNLTCIKIDTNQPVSSKSCQMLSPPPVVQRCEVACPRDCEVSEWGEWGPCKPKPDKCDVLNADSRYMSYKGQRERQRTVIVGPSALGMGCPSLVEIQPCNNPHCFEWKTEPWSSCRLDNQHSKCGSGARSREVKCVSHSGEPVANNSCTDPIPVTREPCLLPCPYDCVVSGWSSWTPCSLPCSSERSMALRSRNRTIIAPPGPGGHPCPNPDEMLQMEGCNLYGCHGYSWMTLPWQECNATCENDGIQTREVYCAEKKTYVSPTQCAFLPKPIEVRSCKVDCPAECEVSPWSEWSTCNSHTCYPNGTRGEITSQSRYRIFLKGENCGTLIEKRECYMSDEVCPKYHWISGNWSDCQLASGIHCGHGLRTRDLWCIQEGSERHAELRFCLSSGEQMPVSVQRCHVDCRTPCQLTEWTQWSPCKQPCSGFKTRSRELMGFSSDHSMCKELDLIESMSCPCAKYYSNPLSEWSSCIATDQITCGTGFRYRAMGCFDQTDQMVDPSLCGGINGLEEEPCLPSCPIDCVLSEWTEWSECNTFCGPGIQNRTRKITLESHHGGRPCGETVQTSICETPCDTFQWQAAGWRECSITSTGHQRSCGIGKQHRQVTCINKLTNEQVPENYCDWTIRPSHINDCLVACPGDCVLSPWSEWSSCPKGCHGNHEQQRTRSMLRAAAHNGAECPHFIQTQSCRLNFTCFTYKWVQTEYASCLPLGGSPCGEGMKSRAVYCLRSDGRSVEDKWCADVQKPSPVDEWCYVDCPVDCEIGDWSDWNLTKCYCGQNGMSRNAVVITKPSPTGRPCLNVVQWKPCPATPCYNWQPGPWTQCQLHGATCGHGVNTRNVSCIRGNDNVTVDPWHCSGLHKPVTWEPCYSPCESDCQLSVWSHWSHCHADCTKDTTGYQTRSRAVIRPPQSDGAEPCPEPLWETRPCDFGPCYTFDWVVTQDGKVICQRSDGLHVIGGCDSKKKPVSPSCEWQDAVCVCGDGSIVLQESACLPGDDNIQAHIYLPNDERLNGWMIAMIGVGCVFIIFVAASIYILCNSGKEAKMGYQTTNTKYT